MRQARYTRLTWLMALALGSIAAQDAPKPAPPVAPAGLSVLWQRSPMPIAGPALLTAGEHALFLSSSETGLSAYSTDDGKTLWTSELVSSVPAVAVAGQIAVVSGGVIHVLAQDTGAEAWRADAEQASSLFALPDRLGAIAGSELRTWTPKGMPAWRTTLPGAPTTRPHFRNGLVLVGTDTPALLALDGVTGEIRWQVPLKAKPLNLGATDDRVFFSAANARLYAYEITPEPKPAWSPYHLIRAIGEPLVDGRHTYFALLDNSVRAFSRSGGTQRWAKVMASRPAAGPMRVGDNVAVVLTNGSVVELACADGQILPSPESAKPSGARLQAAAASLDHRGVFTFTIAGTDVRTLSAWGHPPAKR